MVLGGCQRGIVDDDIQLPKPGSYWGPKARFEIIQKLGSGSSAMVYQAIDHLPEDGPERTVALKILKPWLRTQAANWDEIVEGFRRKAEVLKGLKHVQIPRCFEQGEFQGTHWMSCDIVAGKSLPEWMKKVAVKRGYELADLLITFASALHHAHRRGFVHGDVAPNNLVVEDTDGGTTYLAVLVDWGSAHRVGDPPPAIRRGTTGYMAPDYGTADYRHPVIPDPRDDQFSLAAIGGRIILGVPWDAPLHAELLLEDSDRTRLFPLRMRKGFVRALSEHREDRFPSIKEFAEETLLPEQGEEFREWFDVADDDPVPGRLSRLDERDLVPESPVVSKWAKAKATAVVVGTIVGSVIARYLLGW